MAVVAQFEACAPYLARFSRVLEVAEVFADLLVRMSGDVASTEESMLRGQLACDVVVDAGDRCSLVPQRRGAWRFPAVTLTPVM